MTLTFASVITSAGLDPAEALVIRHAYVREHEDGTVGIHGDSSDAEILAYTSVQSANPRTFPAAPPRVWIVFRPEGGDRARLWSVLVNHGETANDGLAPHLPPRAVGTDERPAEPVGNPVALPAHLEDQCDHRGRVSGDGDR